VALLAGLAWFSPDAGSSPGPQTAPTASTTMPLSSAPAMPPSASPNGTAPSPSPTPTLSSSPAQPADQETEKTTDAQPNPEKAEKGGGKGKH
jgi:serine/threonine-protein kinase